MSFITPLLERNNGLLQHGAGSYTNRVAAQLSRPVWVATNISSVRTPALKISIYLSMWLITAISYLLLCEKKEVDRDNYIQVKRFTENKSSSDLKTSVRKCVMCNDPRRPPFHDLPRAQAAINSRDVHEQEELSKKTPSWFQHASNLYLSHIKFWHQLLVSEF